MILHQIPLATLVCFFIYASTAPGMIFGFVEKWQRDIKARLAWIYRTKGEIYGGEWESKVRKTWDRIDYISKPLFSCPTCMSSVWGSLVYLSLPFYISFSYDIVSWLVFIAATGGLNYVVSIILNRIEAE